MQQHWRLFTTTLFSIILLTNTNAQIKWDNGGGDSLWTTATNWDSDLVPTSTDDVILDNTNVSGGYVVILNAVSIDTVHSLQIGYSGNVNTIELDISDSTTNVLTLKDGGTTALHISDGGVLKNLSASSTRGIRLLSASDVFKMSGTGRYIHATTTTGSAIPQLTSGTTSSNYNFAATSVFENQSGTTASIDSIPVYGIYEYNVSVTKSAGTSLTINGNLLVDQGTFGVSASTTNTFTIAGNVTIANGATFRGSTTGTSTIKVTGNVTGAGTFQGSSSSGTTNITVGSDISTLISFGTGTTSITFSGGTSSVNFSPANASTPTIKNMTIASGKTVTFNPANNINLSVATGNTVTVAGTLNLGTHTLVGAGNLTVTGTLGIGNATGVNGNITLSGTKIYTGATFLYNGTSSQATGTLLPSSIAGLTINNSNGVTLSQNTTITGTLTLTSGKILIGTNNLTVGSAGTISGASSSSYVNTNSSGFLIRNSVATASVPFTVGTASSYTPVSVSCGGIPDNFSVRVQSSFTHTPPDTSNIVNLEWIINETFQGGSNAALAFQWNSSDQKSGFSTSNPVVLGYYTGTQWTESNASLSGSDPYTATASGLSLFSNTEYVIGNSGALPIQLALFTANVQNAHDVNLQWTTISETNNYGFYVERKAQHESSFQTVSDLIPGAGTSLEEHTYNWTDGNIHPATYVYRLRQMDLNGDVSYSNEIRVVVSGVLDAGNAVELPREFSLKQNYPNPFNPSTVIRYQLPVGQDNILSYRVSLKVYNMLGEVVATLVDGVMEAGYKSAELSASQLASGVYFYTLRAGNFTETKKLLLLK